MTTEHDNNTIPWYQVPGMLKRDNTGETLRAFRLCEEWTLKQAAAQVGISYQLLAAYERGEKLPSVQQARRLAVALGIPETGFIQTLLEDQLLRAGMDCQVKLEPPRQFPPAA